MDLLLLLLDNSLFFVDEPEKAISGGGGGRGSSEMNTSSSTMGGGEGGGKSGLGSRREVNKAERKCAFLGGSSGTQSSFTTGSLTAPAFAVRSEPQLELKIIKYDIQSQQVRIVKVSLLEKYTEHQNINTMKFIESEIDKIFSASK